jgi:hypothetical protein
MAPWIATATGPRCRIDALRCRFGMNTDRNARAAHAGGSVPTDTCSMMP